MITWLCSCMHVQWAWARTEDCGLRKYDLSLVREEVGVALTFGLSLWHKPRQRAIAFSRLLDSSLSLTEHQRTKKPMDKHSDMHARVSTTQFKFTFQAHMGSFKGRTIVIFQLFSAFN